MGVRVFTFFASGAIFNGIPSCTCVLLWVMDPDTLDIPGGKHWGRALPPGGESTPARALFYVAPPPDLGRATLCSTMGSSVVSLKALQPLLSPAEKGKGERKETEQGAGGPRGGRGGGRGKKRKRRGAVRDLNSWSFSPSLSLFTGWPPPPEGGGVYIFYFIAEGADACPNVQWVRW